ncbi:MAG: (Fe-S)-binding protein [Gammaproteobacteria bacterium]|nr:(Fe-S)-binding protein [Gammaproteobacteria bacterium]
MPPPINLTKIADQCVMCGMCLPHCPTYQVSQHEAESPRGRISLVKAFSEGELCASSALATHLQSCTGCMKCQDICPANVPYQDIIDNGRQLYKEELSFAYRFIQKSSIALLTHQWGHKLLTSLSVIAKHIHAINKFSILLRLITKSDSTKNSKAAKKFLTILPGCTGSLFDQQTLVSIIKLLNQLDIQTHIPDKIMCCGALAQHSGNLQQADKQIRVINHYISTNNINEFISFASGCGRQYNQVITNKQLAHKDIISWLADSHQFGTADFESCPKRVLVHRPCTQENIEQENVIKLLALIPDIELLEFNDGISCCGAGGMQLITPEDSNRALLDSKINTISTMRPNVIVSSNIGCSLSLKIGIQTTGLDIEVIHPVTLLAQQLKQK